MLPAEVIPKSPPCSPSSVNAEEAIQLKEIELELKKAFFTGKGVRIFKYSGSEKVGPADCTRWTAVFVHDRLSLTWLGIVVWFPLSMKKMWTNTSSYLKGWPPRLNGQAMCVYYCRSERWWAGLRKLMLHCQQMMVWILKRLKPLSYGPMN